MEIGYKVAIEGNIGVGKTSLMSDLVPALTEEMGGKWEVIHERVDEDPEFQRLLTAYYNDPNQRIPLQRWLTQRRLKEFKELDPKTNYILERSFLSDLVFCHLNLIRHERPSGEYITYYYDILEAARSCKYDAVLYLKASPRRCYESMLERGREAEQGVPRLYLEELHAYYETVLPQAARDLQTPLASVYWEQYGSAETAAMLIKNTIKQADNK